MKNIIGICSLLCTTWVLHSCATKNYVDQATLAEWLSKDTFTFMAQRANPMDFAAVNRVTTSIPGAIPSRVLELDYGYTLELNKDTLKIHLPYFGRAYTAHYGTADTGFKWESKDIILHKSEGKKKSSIYTIKVTDKPNIQRIILEIFPNGRANLSIQSTDKQPISYDGYLMQLEKQEGKEK